MWHEGVIGIPQADGTRRIAHYWVKAYGRKSRQYGIEGGKISKLTIQMDGQKTANYDRGWEIEPKDEATQIAFAILMKEYN